MHAGPHGHELPPPRPQRGLALLTRSTSLSALSLIMASEKKVKAGEKAWARCRNIAMAVFWCLSVVLCVLALLERSLNGVRYASLTAATTVTGMFHRVDVGLPRGPEWAEYPSLRPPGTRLPEKDLAPLQEHIDCFSRSGRWVYNATPRYMVSNHFSDGYSTACTRQFATLTGPRAVEGDKANAVVASGNASDWIVRDELKWEWLSDEAQCPLHPFNREHLCRLIGPRQNMLVVGDSINQRVFWTLLNHLVVNRTGYYPKHGTTLQTSGYEVCADVLGPGQGFNLSYVRNDRLSPILHISEDRRFNFYEYPWIHLVDEWNVSVFVLNRGAHFESDANITQSLTNIFSIISKRWPSARVFYRNTPPGHINCTDHHEPLNVRDSYETLTRYLPRNFHWADFPKQNEIARNITRRFGYPFIDLDTLIAVRPDSHIHNRDCLHHCIPGPMDVFPKLFYNTMRLLS